MGRLRNISRALAVTVALVGSLLYLFPEGAQAVTVDLNGSGVGLQTASGDFNVTFAVDIPDGQHVQLDHAEILVTDSAGALDNSGTLLGPYACHATTGGSTETAVIVGITGQAPTQAGYQGTGYDVAFAPGYGYGPGATEGQGQGYGYHFTNPATVVDSGTGYGYGHGNGADTRVTVQVTVSGCDFALLYGPDGLFDARVQAFAGTVGVLFKSFPVETTFADPGAATRPVSTGTVSTQTAITASGGQAAVVTHFTTSDGDKIASGTRLTVTPPADQSGGTKTIEVTPKVDLPSGSRVDVVMSSPGTGSAPDRGDPPFGINVAALQAQTALDPAFYFSISMELPGVGQVDPNDYIGTLDVTFVIDGAFFQGIQTKQFRVVGFTDDGQLKSSHPRVLRTADVGPDREVTFRIQSFSSFAGVAGPALGGGGGGSTTTTAPVPVVTTPVETTPPPVDTIPPPVDTTPPPVVTLPPEPPVTTNTETNDRPQEEEEPARTGGEIAFIAIGMVALIGVLVGGFVLWRRRV